VLEPPWAPRAVTTQVSGLLGSGVRRVNVAGHSRADEVVGVVRDGVCVSRSRISRVFSRDDGKKGRFRDDGEVGAVGLATLGDAVD